MRGIIVLYFAAVCAADDLSEPLTLIDLGDSPLARCLDGSPAGYYFKPASTPRGANSWMIHMQGGGECATATRCLKEAKTHLGSSTQFPKAHNFTSLLLDARKDVNPDFFDWNLVYLPYCSQDLYSGGRTNKSDETFGLYFSGKHIMDATLDALDAHNLTAAANIVVTGDSAGGQGTYLNLDRIADRYPQAHTVGAPIAGFEFYAWPYSGPAHTKSELCDFRVEAMPNHLKVWQTVLPPRCTAHHPTDPYACILACSGDYASGGSSPGGSLQTLSDTINAPLFVIEAQSDSVVLMYHDWLPPKSLWPIAGKPAKQYLADFHANETKCLEPAAVPSRTDRGFFNPACFIHTEFTDAIKIKGRSYRQAFGDFFYKRGPPPKLADDCGELCNPTCN